MPNTLHQLHCVCFANLCPQWGCKMQVHKVHHEQQPDAGCTPAIVLGMASVELDLQAVLAFSQTCWRHCCLHQKPFDFHQAKSDARLCKSGLIRGRVSAIVFCALQVILPSDHFCIRTCEWCPFQPHGDHSHGPHRPVGELRPHTAGASVHCAWHLGSSCPSHKLLLCA